MCVQHLHKIRVSTWIYIEPNLARTVLKAGAMKIVKSRVRAGGVQTNHNAKRLVVRSAVKAGGVQNNHNGRRLLAR